MASLVKLQKLFLVIIMALLALFCSLGLAVAEDRQEAEPKGWQLMPRLGLGVDYGGYVLNDEAFTSRLRRRFELDAIQYGRHIFYLEFDEETFIGTPSDKWDLNLLRYRLYFGYLYDLTDYYLGLFFNHWCFNPIATEKFPSRVGRTSASLYFVTAAFYTKSLRLGMKDRGINFEDKRSFEFLGRWNYGLWISKETSSDNPQVVNFNWVYRVQLRYDILRYRNLIPYVDVEGELTTGPSTRLTPKVEVGARYHLRNQVDLIPFFEWGREQENLEEVNGPNPFRRVAQNYLLGGLRCETLLDRSEASEDLVKDWQILPEIHGNMGYSRYLQSRFYGWGGNIEVDLEVLRSGPWTAFLYSNLKVDTRKGNFGLLKGTGDLQYGITYASGFYFVETFLEHQERFNIKEFTNPSERSHLAGVRLGTKGMKPGHFDDGISFTGPKFQWLNHWNGEASVGHYFQNRNWQYLWDIMAQVRWDPFRWYFVIPYVMTSINWQSGGGQTADVVEYATESGVRLHGALDLCLYYRFQHQDNALFFRGPEENQTLFGLRALF